MQEQTQSVEAPRPVVTEDISKSMNPVEPTPKEAEAVAPGIPVETAAPKPAQPPIEVKKPDKIAERFIELAKKEKAISARKKEIEEKESRIAKLQVEEDSKKKLLQDDPEEFLKLYGTSYEKVTKRILDGKGNAPSELTRLQERIAQLESEREAEKKELEAQRQTKSYMEIEEDVKNTIKSSEKIDLVKYVDGSEQFVLQKIQQHYMETLKSGEPVLLSNEEAAELVEKDLEPIVKRMLQSSKKVQAWLSESIKKDSPADESAKKQATTPTAQATLTNRLHQNTPDREKKPLSKDESLSEAAKLIRWTTQ